METNKHSLRLIPYEVRPGALLMAADEAMLGSALKGQASLRFYGWSEATLSLGYFQHHGDRLNSPLLTDRPFVRRHTGGGAILHHHELTYSLALPAGSPWHNEETWLCRFHHLLVKVLRGFGVESRAVICGEEKKLDPFLCFKHQTPGDLLINGHKVVGSAQRRPHGATLQHGSILLQGSAYTPVLPGIADLSGVQVGIKELAAALQEELVRDTGWTLEAGDWTPEEIEETSRLEREKYGSPEWNLRR